MAELIISKKNKNGREKTKIENYVSSADLEEITKELALKAVKSEVDAALDLLNEALEGKADKDHAHDAYALKTELEALQGTLEEQIKGKIQPGMLADFVVLGDNPFAVTASSIKDIPVRATYLGGKQVYCA